MTQTVQARLSDEDVRQFEEDLKVLGISNRSEAMRRALKLLHREARQAKLAQSYDDFYGEGNVAPLPETVDGAGELAAELNR